MGPLQDFFRREMTDFEGRVRDKMKALRNEVESEFLSVSLAASEIEPDDEKINKRALDDQQGEVERQPPRKSVAKKRRNGKRKAVAQAVDDGCMYDCEDTAETCVCCDLCEKWFHARCAGYEEELVADPVHHGHPIELAAFCKACLKDRGLTHRDILNQHREYARIEAFFERNSAQWMWKHVSQDGRCCLNGIWNQQGRFEDFVAACAKAAVAKVKESDVLTQPLKREFTLKFKELKKYPGKLASLWPQLEVEFLWLGLTSVVMPNLQIKLYELDKNGLTCIQSFPENGSGRSACFRVLQWNRKVAGHFDLIEQRSWPVDTVLEAEMMDDNFPTYRDTIHPVRVVEVLNDGKEYRCEMLAFGEQDVWAADLLHAVRAAEEASADLKEGDLVHVRMRKRKVRGKLVDGHASKDGIWVKGVLVQEAEQEDDFALVEHADWERHEGRKRSRVRLEDIRRAW